MHIKNPVKNKTIFINLVIISFPNLQGTVIKTMKNIDTT